LKQIEIKTSDRISIQFPLAELKDRALAFLLDSILLYSFIFILLSLYLNMGGVNTQGFILIVILPIFLFYSLISELVMSGQSIGKKAMAIRVVKINGQYASNLDYLIRWLFRWLDLWLSFFVIASVLINSSKYNQRLGDILAGTSLIKLKEEYKVGLSEILKIESQSNYEAKYPQVTQLKDEDMVLVKKAILRYEKHKNDAHRILISKLTKQLQEDLKIEKFEGSETQFLNTLIKDYVVLTRS